MNNTDKQLKLLNQITEDKSISWIERGWNGARSYPRIYGNHKRLQIYLEVRTSSNIPACKIFAGGIDFYTFYSHEEKSLEDALEKLWEVAIERATTATSFTPVRNSTITLDYLLEKWNDPFSEPLKINSTFS